MTKQRKAENHAQFFHTIKITAHHFVLLCKEHERKQIFKLAAACKQHTCKPVFKVFYFFTNFINLLNAWKVQNIFY